MPGERRSTPIYKAKGESAKMKRLVKGNLQRLWKMLDEVDGTLYNVQDNIYSIKDMPDNIRSSIIKIDISAITTLKNDIEELIEELEK